MGKARRTNAPYLPGLREGVRYAGSAVRLPAGYATSMVRSGVNQAALLWTRTGRGGGRTAVNSQPYSARRGRRG